MKKMYNRFWDFLFHPSVRQFVPKNGKALVFRYPSPGNQPEFDDKVEARQDFKTPYEQSSYNVRYAYPTPQQTQHHQEVLLADSPLMTSIQKLKLNGFLKEGQENNKEAIEKATAGYIKKFGFGPDKRIYRNDGDMKILKSKDRQEIASFIESQFKERSDLKKSGLDYSINKHVTENDEIYPMESLDLYADPQFQMLRIHNEIQIEDQIKANVERAYIDIKRGDSRFWKALDDSHDPKEIQKVQQHIGDPQPNTFEIRKGKVQLEIKDGQVYDLHPKQQK